MANLASTRSVPSLPQPGAVLQLLKPVTWFPPMWAFACGAVSAGLALTDHWGLVLAGMALSGPLVCGTSQAVNDWYDRHVDAINEPNRPIPSGRMPGRWGLYIAIIWTRAVAGRGAGADRARRVLGRLLRHGHGLGLFGAAACASSRMAGGAMRRWACAMRGCRGSPGRPCCSAAVPAWPIDRAGAALFAGRAWHHDAQRLQGHRGRHADGRALAARAAWRSGCGARRLRR